MERVHFHYKKTLSQTSFPLLLAALSLLPFRWMHCLVLEGWRTENLHTVLSNRSSNSRKVATIYPFLGYFQLNWNLEPQKHALPCSFGFLKKPEHFLFATVFPLESLTINNSNMTLYSVIKFTTSLNCGYLVFNFNSAVSKWKIKSLLY